MPISPLAIHCTSYCLDAFSSDGFDKLSVEEICQHKREIYELLQERVAFETKIISLDYQFLNQVTDAIIEVLYRGHQDRTKRDTQDIITYLESCIENALQQSSMY